MNRLLDKLCAVRTMSILTLMIAMLAISGCKKMVIALILTRLTLPMLRQPRIPVMPVMTAIQTPRTQAIRRIRPIPPMIPTQVIAPTRPMQQTKVTLPISVPPWELNQYRRSQRILARSFSIDHCSTRTVARSGLSLLVLKVQCSMRAES